MTGEEIKALDRAETRKVLDDFWRLWQLGRIKGHLVFSGERGAVVQIQDRDRTNGCQLWVEGEK